MADSATEVCNLSLDLLSSETIENIVDPSNPTEDILFRWYDKTRVMVLRQHPWNFAIKRAVLAKNSDSPAFGYDYSYALPSDCIRILGAYTSEGVVVDPRSYEVEGRNILYSGDGVYLRYIKDYTDVPTMDALFIDWLVAEIALGIAYKQTGSNTDIERLMKIRDNARNVAVAIDGQESPPKRVERSRMKRSRRVGSKRTDMIEW